MSMEAEFVQNILQRHNSKNSEDTRGSLNPLPSLWVR